MRSRVLILMFAALLTAVGLVAGLSLGQQSGVIAQPPTVDDRLDNVEDDLARLKSDVQGARTDLTRALDELSGLRGDVAVLSQRVQRMSRIARPTQSEDAAYTQTFVEDAIDKFEHDGREATIAYFNSPESVDGQWYLFIFDEDGVLVAHEDSELVGSNAAEVNGPDGYPAGRMIAAVARPEGAWVDYQFHNPASGREQIKHSWIVRHDGLIFGSGWYEDAPSKIHAPGAFTQSYVERAIEMYRVLGREATFKYYNSPSSADGEWYMFIHRADGTRLVHAHRAEVEGWLGSSISDATDVTGHNYGAEMMSLESDGWVSYVFENPAQEGAYQRKHSRIVPHDGLLFGSGWYDRNYDLAEQDPAGYARLLVQQAIERYDEDGRAAKVEHLNSPAATDGEWYVFVIDRDDTWLAHPSLPLGGSVLDTEPDARGYDFAADIVAVEDRDWVSYVFHNPGDDRLEQKHTWVVRHDGLLFAAGWYEPGAYEVSGS